MDQISLREKIAFFPLQRPKLCLILGFLLFAVITPWSANIKFDFSATVWFSETDPLLERLRNFEQTFGSDESVVVLVELHEGDIFTPKVIELIQELTERVWEVPLVSRVESLTNYHWSYAEGDNLITEPFIPEELAHDENFLLERRIAGLEHSVLPGVFFSRDGQSAMIFGRLALNPTSHLRHAEILSTLNSILDEYKDPAWKLHSLGQPVLSANFQEKSFRDIFLLTPILVLLVLVYLYWTFRSLMGVAIPFSIIVASIGFTGGMTGLLGAKVNSLTFILPSILIAISIADSIHLLATFFDQFSKTKKIDLAAQRSLLKNLGPIFLTTLSTSIGFFSLSFSDILPVRELGILAALGTISAMIFSYLWVVPLLLLFVSRQVRSSKPMNQRMLSRTAVASYLHWVESNATAVLISFAIITVAGVWLGLKNIVDSNPYKYFKESDQLSQSNQYSLDHYGGVAGPELMIDSLTPGGAKEPKFLQEVESFQNWLNERPVVNRVMSIIDILKEMNKALFEGDEAEYRIHPQKDVIAQELFLYTIGLPLGMDINNRMDLAEQKVRLSLLWSLQDSAPSLAELKVIEDEAQRRGLDVQSTGKSILFQQMNEHVVYTFFTSMGAAIFLISIILFWVYRSFTLGLISLIPNCVPVFLGAGLLYLLGKPIDIGTAIVASVTLGIAVDDTIHFLSHYHRLTKDGMERMEALIEVLSSTGLALMITTFILATCFGLFIFASLVPNINFGILCAFVLTMALVCDLIILPAILLKVRLNHSSS
jgi:uncharacterized protein